MLGGHTFKSAPGTPQWHFAFYEDGQGNKRLLLPSPFQGASQVILQVNDLRNIRIQALTEKVYAQSFVLRVISTYYSRWSRPIRGRIQPTEQKLPAAFCHAFDETISQVNLYVEMQERAFFDFRSYFTGFNLTFEAELGSFDTASVDHIGPIQSIAASDLASDAEFIAISSYQASNNMQYIAKLLEVPDKEIEDTYSYKGKQNKNRTMQLWIKEFSLPLKFMFFFLPELIFKLTIFFSPPPPV